VGAMKVRHKRIPQRSCIACKQKKDKRKLNRLVFTNDEGLVLDFSGKLDGRGAYLCDDPVCWNLAIKSKLLDRSLQIDISETEKNTLEKYFSKTLAG
jgi:predicted RNA-binding protein YlxR (DUF448 family)